MLKNYFSIALRNLVNNPMHSAIKVAGLAVGVAGCLVIFLIAQYELSFDTFQHDRESIFRIYSHFKGLQEGLNRGVPNVLPQKVRDEFTGLQSVTTFLTWSTNVMVEDSTREKRKIENQNDIIITDPDYFDVFNMYQWLAGSPKVLQAPFSVVLTESKAKKYFGRGDLEKIIGRKIIYRDSLEVTLAGVVKDIPDRTDFYFTDFISFSTVQRSWLKNNHDFENWGSTNSSTQCFIKLAKGTTPEKIADQMPLLTKAYMDKSTDSGKGQPPESPPSYELQPLSDMHFNTTIGIFDNSRGPVSLPTLETLMVIAVLLLLMAAVNFINLETAQALRRAREVGVRKVMGGTRASLIFQFLAESLSLTTIAVLTALALCYLIFKFFGEFIPEGLKFTLADPFLWIFVGITVVVATILSGLYPAFILSSYQPAVVLKNQLNSRQSRAAYMRKVLTVFQFSFSQVLIVATLIIGWQINFMLDKDMGFTKDAIVSFNTPWWEKASKRSALKNELDQLSEVSAISQYARAPVSNGWSTTTATFNNGKEDIKHTVHIKSGDTTYLTLFDLKLVAGRNVQPYDSIHELLINETYCQKLGVEPIDMVGQTLVMGRDQKFTVAGILKDFHFQSLHHTIEPMYYKYETNRSGFSLKLATAGQPLENLDKTLEKITRLLSKMYPDQKIDFVFLDQTVEQFYRAEKRTAKLTNTAMGLAIFISCLGLFGLASYTSLQRTKEIGIRKVLGATVNNIVALLSKEFLVLVFLAFVIATPLAWFAATKWLSDFAYHVDLSAWVFLLSGALSVLIAFLTVGLQAMKAAVRNPVDSLRYE